MNLYEAPAKYEKVISINEDNSEQIRLVIKVFEVKSIYIFVNTTKTLTKNGSLVRTV